VTVGAIDDSVLFSPTEKKGVARTGSAAQLLVGASKISQTPSIAHRAHFLKRPPEAHADLMLRQYLV
jgi:hypothetical protein